MSLYRADTIRAVTRLVTRGNHAETVDLTHDYTFLQDTFYFYFYRHSSSC